MPRSRPSMIAGAVPVALVFAILAAITPTPLAAETGPKVRRHGAVAKGFDAPRVSGELLVKLRPDQGKLPLDSLDAAGVRFEERFAIDSELVLATATGDAERAADTLARDPRVEYVEPNYLYQTSAVPNDPRYRKQWGLDYASDDGDVGAPEAWDVTTGSSDVVVAIVDTGIDLEHPDLVDNLYRNPGEVAGNGRDDDGNGYVDDVNGWDAIDRDGRPEDESGHGTHVAGIVGARGNNGRGVTGVCWNVTLMPLRFIQEREGSTANAIKCIDYAVEARRRGVNVRVMNNSWGGYGYSQALAEAVARATAAGILVVCAAGNEHRYVDSTPSFPAGLDLPGVVSVGASGSDGYPAPFSNFGKQAVDLFAPGWGIQSTLPGGYGNNSGTSMASPFVAGIAALAVSAFPDSSVSQLKARVLGATVRKSSGFLDYYCLTGGIASAPRALRTDAGAPSPLDDFRLVGSNASGMSVAWTAVDDGDSGAATYYDIRWSPSPITEANFESAAQLEDARVPKAAGEPETLPLAGCVAGGGPRFVAMRAYDWAGNYAQSRTLSTEDLSPVPAYEAVAPYFSDTGFDEVAFGDDTSVRVDLPYEIPFFGVPYRSVYVSTNGALSFDGPLPRAPQSADDLAGRAVIAPLWADLESIAKVWVTPDWVNFSWQARTHREALRDPDGGHRDVEIRVTISRQGRLDFRYDVLRAGALSELAVPPVTGISDGGCHTAPLAGFDGDYSVGFRMSALSPRPSDGNRPPSLEIEPFPSTLTEGQTVVRQVTVSDPEGEDIRVAASYLNYGTGFLDPYAYTYTYTPGPNEAGRREIVFTATDASGHSTTRRVTVDVVDDPQFPEVLEVRKTATRVTIMVKGFKPGAKAYVGGRLLEDAKVSSRTPLTKITSKMAVDYGDGTSGAYVVNPDGRTSNAVFVSR